MTPRVRRLAASPRADLVVYLLSLVPMLPALGAGLVADDYLHRGVFLRLPVLGGGSPLLGLFRFATAGSGQLPLREIGVLPWSTPPFLSLVFFRPLSAATHWLDFALWPDTPVLAHLHSLLWFALVVFLVLRLFRSLAHRKVALLAALFFAVDPAHAWPAGWIANRNALVAMAFGLGALLLHQRARRGGRLLGLWPALLCFVAALCAAEAGLGVLAYLVASELWRERDSLRRRLLWLAPYAVVVLVWRLLYSHFGFGARGSSLYVDPVREPLNFLFAVLQRGPLLLAGHFSVGPIDGWILLPTALQIACSVAATVLVVLGLRWLWPAVKDPDGRFWLGGMLLSLLPVCAAFPTSRLLLWPSVGGFLLLSRRVWMAFDDDAPAGAPRLRRWPARLALWVHLPFALLSLLAAFASLRTTDLIFRFGADHAPNDAALAQQSLVFVNGNDFISSYTLLTRMVEGTGVVSRRVVKLSYVLDRVEVERVDERTLRLRPENGFLFQVSDRLLYSPDFALPAGTTLESPDFSVEVLDATPEGRPLEADFHFHQRLESASYRFICFDAGQLVPFPLPAVGQTRVLEPSFPTLYE